MKIIKRMISPLFLAMVLTSCGGFMSSPSKTSPTLVMETAVALARTSIAETQTALPTIILTAPLPTTVPNLTPEITLTPLFTDDDSFWENLGSMPSNISITEYALPSGKNPNEEDGLFQYVPTQAWPVRKANISPTPHQITLEELGYEIKKVSDTTDRKVYIQQLYRDGRFLLDDFMSGSEVYTFSTKAGTITAFIVEVDTGTHRQNYVIQNDAINAFGGYAIFTSSPVLYEEELLWAATYSDRVEIKKSNGNVIYTHTTPWRPNHHTRFRAWNGHWILEVNSTVIQDGEIISQKLGFQKVFNWSLVKDKPIYFFQKGSKIGLSYDGNILPINYQNVAHDLCCSPAQNNPSIRYDEVHFFGKQDGVWHYVVMKFK